MKFELRCSLSFLSQVDGSFEVLSVDIPGNETVLSTYVEDLVASACQHAMPDTLDAPTHNIITYRQAFLFLLFDNRY